MTTPREHTEMRIGCNPSSHADSVQLCLQSSSPLVLKIATVLSRLGHHLTRSKPSVSRNPLTQENLHMTESLAMPTPSTRNHSHFLARNARESPLEFSTNSKQIPPYYDSAPLECRLLIATVSTPNRGKYLLP
jgi:hypothetical protein